jgi:uncharacterized protein
MQRLIFIGLIIWLVIYVLKRSLHKPNAAKNEEDKSDKSNIEDMVQCDHCAVHLPRSEAFLVDGKIYCSKAHIQKK